MAICGQIINIIRPLYGRLWKDLAGLRLLVETPDGHGEWEKLYDVYKSTDFTLQDSSGKMIVEHSDKADIIGTSTHPTTTQIRDLLAVNHMPVELNKRYLRYTLWELRLGQTVEVAGERVNNRVLSARTIGATSSGQRLTSINKLRKEKGDYCLHGRISLVALPVDDDSARPLALLRLAIHVKDEFNHWVAVFDQPPGKLSPFCLADGTGCAWVVRHPDLSDAEISLPQVRPRVINDEQAGKYLGLLGIDELPQGRQYQNQVWEFRLNDDVTVCGEVDTWWMITYKPARFKIL